MSSHGLLVSVIVPTYNREALLPLAIQSVLGQTHLRWELFVVDEMYGRQTSCGRNWIRSTVVAGTGVMAGSL